MKTYDELCADFDRKDALAELRINELKIAERQLADAVRERTAARNALLAYSRANKSKLVGNGEVMA